MSENEKDTQNSTKPTKIRNVFSEYSETSTVHGIRYICGEGKCVFVRFWWMIAVSASVYFCVTYIHQAWFKFHISPVIVSFAEEPIPVSSVPFPTITVCNDFLINSAVWNASFMSQVLYAKQKGYDAKTIQRVQTVSHFCSSALAFDNASLRHENVTIQRNMLPYLEEMTPQLFNPRDICVLSPGNILRCAKIFRRSISDAGICYTFNSPNELYKINSLADDFPETKSLENPIDFLGSKVNLSYPFKVLNSDEGLEIQIKAPKKETEFHDVCSNANGGLKIQFHSPHEMPRMKEHFYFIPFEHNVQIKVRPNMMLSSDGLVKNHSKEKRRCVANTESDLVLFKIYTQKNCYLETFIVAARKSCECVLFWMPRDNQTKVCNVREDFECVDRIENDLKRVDLTQKCLPACNMTTYDIGLSASKLVTRTSATDAFRRVNIKIVMRDQVYYPISRSESYTKMDSLDFLATCGGVLNLFMGISILSIIEIVYFALVHFMNHFSERNTQSETISASQSSDQNANNTN